MADLTSFDPFAQSFTLLMSDGTPFNVSMPELDDFILYNVQISINYASQLGASLILLVILLLLTKPEKRQSAIFIFNCVSLVINVIRNVIQCVYFTGPFSEVYAYFGQDYSRVTASDYATSVAGTVLTTVLLVCVEVSLILQVRVVCVTLRSAYREAVSVFTILTAFIAIGFRLALCIQNAKAIVLAQSEFSLHWLSSASNIAFTISICCVCAVFVIKLGIALNQRSKLGLGQFGPMKIIFIMGCQTLVIPAIFSILQYFTSLPAMSSNVLTLVVIFLPLSSLWASSAAAVPQASHQQPLQYRRKLIGSLASGSTGLALAKDCKGPLSPTDTAGTRTSNLSPPGSARTDKMFRDLEAQGMQGMDHFFGVGKA